MNEKKGTEFNHTPSLGLECIAGADSAENWNLKLSNNTENFSLELDMYLGRQVVPSLDAACSRSTYPYLLPEKNILY